MKICFITEYFPTGSNCDVRGGAEAVAFHEAKHLSKNHDVEVITSYEPGTKREDEFENIKVLRCGRARRYIQKDAFIDRFLFMQSAFSLGKKRTYDLIVGFNFLTYPIAWRLSRKLQVPCILRYHDVLIGRWISTFGITGIIGEIIERRTLSKNYAAIIAVSEYTAKNLRNYFKNEDKIHVLHNGIEQREVPPTRVLSQSIVCVSRLVKYKHVDDLIKALALLCKTFPELQCKIVGTGPEEHKLKRLVRELNLESHITFLGFINDHEELLHLIGSSVVTCLPSSLEGFGIVVLESMSCGVPFIAAEIPPIVEVSDRKGGLFFQPKNIIDLASKLELLLSDVELQKRLALEGQKRAQEFLWDNLSKSLESIYKKSVDEWEYRK